MNWLLAVSTCFGLGLPGDADWKLISISSSWFSVSEGLLLLRPFLGLTELLIVTL